MVLIACSSTTEHGDEPIANNEKQVNDIMDKWHLAAAQADFDAYFNAMDSSAVYVGTAAEEVWSKAEFAKFSKPYFDKGKAWDFKVINRNVHFMANSNIMYFDELLNTWMGECRGSGVLVLNDAGEWKIKHYVLSLVVPNDDIKGVIQLIKD